jgi:deoxyhypusine synthase
LKFKPLDFTRLKTYSLSSRKSKVEASFSAKALAPGLSFAGFLDSLPEILGAKDLKALARAIAEARRGGKTVILGMGAHVIKVGLTPVIIDLMERGIINALAMNGACVVHDFEMAYQGQTSEDVDAEIGTGAFGMAKETGGYINAAIVKGVGEGLGLGASVGKAIAEGVSGATGEGVSFKFPEKSLLAAAYRLNVPAMVHVAIGTDIIHMHPSCDGAATGEGSLRDFRTFCSVVASMEGGVYINLGAAIILPEAFLKAVTLARNLGSPLSKITTANMDFIQGYRPNTNVVRRPTMKGGKGYSLTGHHEIMFPLLAAAVLEELNDVR